MTGVRYARWEHDLRAAEAGSQAYPIPDTDSAHFLSVPSGQLH